MSKSRIEWCEYSINPVKGLCPVDCKDNQGKSYCYARRMYLNPYYKAMYEHPEIRFDSEACYPMPRKPSRIFVGSTIELFGEWVKPKWLKWIFNLPRIYPQHTFIFLTKKPENLLAWSPFPENCWIGLTVTHQGVGEKNYGCDGAITALEDIEARVKFISFEPLLSKISTAGIEYFCNWVIIGQQTPVKKATMPKISWVEEIVNTADKAGIPVFLKENLERIFGYPLPEWAEDKILNTRLRQEFPKQEQY